MARARPAASGSGPRWRVTPTIDLSLGEVGAALALVAVALVVSRWQRADLEADIGVAVLRSFVQLTAVG
ncbi:MAG: ABC transporter permease, partial [Thermoleophilaceae bacterium]